MMNTPSLVLLVFCTATVSLVLAEICPYTHPNCKCQGTKVTCINLDRIPPLHTGSDVTAVDALRFEDGSITDIPDNSLPSGLVDIFFSRHPLTNISDEAFSESATTLKYLYFMSVGFTWVPDALTNLTNLRNLTFNVMDIYNWNSPALQNIARSLVYLNLISIDLSMWPEWIYQCHSLNRLRIFDGNITDIPEDAFNLMNNTLTSLVVSMSDLTKVPKALHSLRNLTSLDLSSNILDDVNGRPGLEQIMTFPWAQKLETLTAINSFVTSIPNLSNATSLVKLELFLNDISQVNSDMLPTSLVYLSLASNNIIMITDKSFKNLFKLETLYLGSNPILDVFPMAFRDLISLRSLDLSKTKLTQIPVAIISLSSLTSLNIETVVSLQCPCPSQTELTSWYALRNGTVTCTGLCCTHESISSYLSGTCKLLPPCPTGGATAIVCSIGCKYACLLLLLFAYFYHL